MTTDHLKTQHSDHSSPTLVSFHGHMLVKEEYEALLSLEQYIVKDDSTSKSLLIITQNRLTQIALSNISLAILLQTLPAFTHLTYLYIRSEEITTLENLPSSLCTLESLRIYCPNLVSLHGIPPCLDSLQALTIFSKKLSHFTGLPPQLPRLTSLKIKSCPIVDLGDSFLHSFSLRELWIVKTDLKSLHGLPPSLPHLKELRVLDSAIESLEGLPSDLPALQICNIGIYRDGRYYDLSKERKESLPFRSLKGFPQNAPKLEELSINWTSLTSFHGLAPNLPNLRLLYVPFNQLISLYGLPVSLDSLQEFYINFNQLVSFEGCPPCLLKLTHFECSGNYLRNFEHLPRFSILLRTPSFAGNPFQSLAGLRARFLKEEDNMPLETIIDFEMEKSALTVETSFPLIAMNESTLKSFHSESLHSLWLNLYRLGLFHEKTKFISPTLDLTEKGHALVEKIIVFTLSSYPIQDVGNEREPTIDETVYMLPDAFGSYYALNKEFIAELFAYYRLSPLELAFKYASTKQLTGDEKERLLHEADILEIKVLMEYLQSDDPILCKIQKHPENDGMDGEKEEVHPLWLS